MVTYADKPFAGAVGFRVARDGIDEVGQGHAHGRGGGGGAPSRVGAVSVSRSLVVGDTLFTVSSVGVKAVSLSGLVAEQGWVPFGTVGVHGSTLEPAAAGQGTVGSPASGGFRANLA